MGAGVVLGVTWVRVGGRGYGCWGNTSWVRWVGVGGGNLNAGTCRCCHLLMQFIPSTSKVGCNTVFLWVEWGSIFLASFIGFLVLSCTIGPLLHGVFLTSSDLT